MFFKFLSGHLKVKLDNGRRTKTRFSSMLAWCQKYHLLDGMMNKAGSLGLWNSNVVHASASRISSFLIQRVCLWCRRVKLVYDFQMTRHFSTN